MTSTVRISSKMLKRIGECEALNGSHQHKAACTLSHALLLAPAGEPPAFTRSTASCNDA